MSPWLSRAEQLFLGVNRWAVILALSAMACLVFANVTLRYFTNNSIVWAEEVARYLMIWMTFLSAGLALRGGLLVAIAQVHMRFTPAVGRAIRTAMLVILAGFCLWMIWSGIGYMNRMGRQLTPATRISFWYIYLAMPLGFGLMAAHILLLARRFVTTGRFDDSQDQSSAVGG